MATRNILSGPDALVLMLNEELRSWKQRGVTFVLAVDDTINVEMLNIYDRDLLRKAQDYRAKHAEELRRLLAFVGDRDPDDAIRHLGFSWELRATTMTEEWKPARVRGLESEKAALEKRLGEVNAERDEIQRAITRTNDAINAELKHGARDAEAAV